MCCSFWEKCINSQKNGQRCSTPLRKILYTNKENIKKSGRPKHWFLSYFVYGGTIGQNVNTRWLFCPSVFVAMATTKIRFSPIFDNFETFQDWKWSKLKASLHLNKKWKLDHSYGNVRPLPRLYKNDSIIMLKVLIWKMPLFCGGVFLAEIKFLEKR